MKPWIAESAVVYLEGKAQDLAGLKVFEWGSGSSTVWWASLCGEIITVEHNHEWAEQVRRWTIKATVLERLLGEDYWKSILGRDPDFVVIDGRHRKACAEQIFHLDTLPSAVMWDDAQRDWYQCGQVLFENWRKLDFECNLGGGRITRIYVRQDGKLKHWKL